MSPSRLSEAEKQQILELYRLPGETTSTLASRFGVSNSTVSRILKTGLVEADYEALIQQKKRGATSLETTSSETALDKPEVEVSQPQQVSLFEVTEPTDLATPAEPPLVEAEMPVNTVAPTETRRLRRRSSAKDVVETPTEKFVAEAPTTLPPAEEIAAIAEDLAEAGVVEEAVVVTPKKILKSIAKPEPIPTAVPSAADLLDGTDLEDLSGLDDDLDALDDLDEDLEDDDEADSGFVSGSLFANTSGSNITVEVYLLQRL
jgi:transposase-like protein